MHKIQIWLIYDCEFDQVTAANPFGFQAFFSSPFMLSTFTGRLTYFLSFFFTGIPRILTYAFRISQLLFWVLFLVFVFWLRKFYMRLSCKFLGVCWYFGFYLNEAMNYITIRFLVFGVPFNSLWTVKNFFFFD